MIRVLLWDIDGTLLDFAAAERRALTDCFGKFDLGACSDEMLARYSALNTVYWQRLERGELTRRQVQLGRFQEFFAREGISFSRYEDFNLAFQQVLGETVVFRDGADSLVQELRGRVRQYAATNGNLPVQLRKLEKSGLNRLLDGAFISEQVGSEKPSPLFFDRVFAALGKIPRDQVMIVGDSPTSDMQGGNNAGIRCCWYNPSGAPAPGSLRLDYVISSLSQVRDILAEEGDRAQSLL